jgi:rhodanese-related sulfurtransferase
MKKLLVVLLALVFALSMVSMATAKSALRKAEGAYYKSIVKVIPKKMYRTVDDMYKVFLTNLNGKTKVYLLDIRSHPEFDAFHIEGASHIHAGHFYTIPKWIKDKNADIWVYCRTQHRSGYVTGWLYKFGYTNVKWVRGGIVAWIKKGYPIFNFFLGRADKGGVHYRKPKQKMDERGFFVREWRYQR